MDSVLKSEPAMSVLAGISLAEFLIIVLILVGAGIAIYRFKDKIKGFLENYRQKANKKEAESQKFVDFDRRIKQLEQHHDEDMMNMVSKQEKYRSQSLQKQADIDNHFNSLESKMDEMTQALKELKQSNEEIKASNDKVKKNELKDRLIQMHGYYTSPEKNPSKEWSEMEANNFWDLFEDYEERGGNGYVHNKVKPEMEALKVIYF